MTEYKGLTIKIGGDSSSLNTALKSSTKAAATLESQIRQITRAMRFDPGKLANIDTRMKITADRAEALQTKIFLLKNAYKELGDTIVTVGGSATSVKKLAESTDNIALAASAAKERYNEMTASLAANYRELEARAAAAGKKINLNALSRQGSENTFEKQMASLKQLGVITDEEIQKLRVMRATWNEAFQSSEGYKAASEFDKMAIDMQRFESEAKNAIATVRELNTVSKYAAENWSETNAKVKALDSSMSEAAKQAKAYEEALRQNPANVNAALGRLKALSNEHALAEQKAGALNNQVAEYRKRLASVIATEKNLPEFIKRTGDAWDKVQNELKQAEGEVNALAQRLQHLKDVQAPQKEIDKLEKELDQASEKADKLNMKAREMDAAFETSKECAELQQLQVEAAQAESHVENLEKRMQMTNLGNGSSSLVNASTWKSLGMSLYSTVTPAVTMFGWRAVSAAKDIDAAYRDMRKTVDGTESQFERLKEAAIEFSKTHVTSASQILEIEAMGGQLGIAVEDLEKFSEVVANLSIAGAGMGSTEDIAITLGKLGNVMNLDVEEFDNFADALVRLGNNFPAIEGDILNITSRFGAMGTIVGMTPDKILAIATAATATNMQAEAAGGSLLRTLGRLESAVAGVSEGMTNLEGLSEEDMEAFDGAKEKLQEYADVADMTAEEFAELWGSDAAAAFQKFVEGLKRINDEGGSVGKTLTDLGITSIRDRQLLMSLTTTTDVLAGSLKAAKNAYNGMSDEYGAAGDAANEARKKTEGFSGQLEILSNTANAAMASIADGAKPLLGFLTDIAQGVLDFSKSLDEGQKSAIVFGLALSAIVGPGFTLVATMITMRDNITKTVLAQNAMVKALRLVKEGIQTAPAGMSKFGAAMDGARVAASGLAKATAKAFAPIAVIAAISQIVAAVVEYKKHLDNVSLAMKNTGEVIASSIPDAAKSASDSINGLSKTYEEMIAKIAENDREIQSSANDTFGSTVLIEKYAEDVKKAFDAYNENRSAENLADLKNKLALYNEQAGTAITVTEDETGKLSLMNGEAQLAADAFDRLTKSIVNSKKAEFFTEAYKKNYDSYMEALDAVDEKETKLQEARKALEDAKNSPWSDRGQIASYQMAAESAQNALDEANAILDTRKSNLYQAEESMRLYTESTLEAAGAGVRFIADNEKISSAIHSNYDSVTDFAHALDETGLSYDELNSKRDVLEDVASTWDGTSQQIFDALGVVKQSADETGESIEEVGDAAESVDGETVDVEVTDNGTVQFFIDSLTGLAMLQVEDKSFIVSDDGTIWENGKMIGELNGEIANIDGAEYRISDDGTANIARQDAINVRTAVNDIPSSKTSSIYANVHGLSDVKSLVDWIDRLQGKSIDVVTNYVSHGSPAQSATGSMSNAQYIPRHAAGYIATGPTLTNNGWVGEAGAEAVLNWGTGGAVVPLTNSRYMEPIAAAIAENMGASDSGTVVFNVYTNDNPEVFATKAMRRVDQIRRSEGR